MRADLKKETVSSTSWSSVNAAVRQAVAMKDTWAKG